MDDSTGVLSDADLVQRAWGDDAAAFEELVRRHQRQLYAMLYRLCGNEDDARDLVQKCFVNAFTAIKGFRGEASFGTWVRHIAMNNWRNFVRSESKRRHLDLDDTVADETADTHAEVEEAQLRTLLWEESRRLPPRQQEALVLRAQMGLGFLEVADIMGCTVGAAKASYHQAVKKLKERLKE